MKKIYLGLIALLSIFTACSDVEIPESASDAVATVSNLRYENPEGTRQVTLLWDNPVGVTGIQLIKDLNDVTDFNSAISSYLIEKAPINTDVAYTVKARYEGDVLSKGQTIRFNIKFDIPEADYQIAMVVANDYAESADERAAVAWFEENYVYKGIGVVLTAAEIGQLNIDKNPVCWVMCDRIGIEWGYDKLPGALNSTATINALKTYGEKGGNLLLTAHATQLVAGIGRVDNMYAPRLFGSGEGGDNGDVWGIQPVIGNREGQTYDHSAHPIYTGMTYADPGNAYGHPIYSLDGAGHKGDHNCMWDLNAGEHSLVEAPNKVADFENKTNSVVLGTWQHVVDYCCAGVVDFAPTTTFAGRVLAIGTAAYEWDMNGKENAYIDQVKMLTSNSLNYLNRKVAMLVPNDYAESADERAAVEWFQENYVYGGKGVLLTPATINQLDVVQHAVCWVMCDRIGIEWGYDKLPGALNSTATINALKTYGEKGGNLLLTAHATQLVAGIGRVDNMYAPRLFGSGEGGDNGDVWGIQPVIGNREGQTYDHSAHPIYTGMTYADPGNAYGHPIYSLDGAGHKGDHNCMWDLNAGEHSLVEAPNKVADFENKTNSVVLGTWQHVVDYCCAGVVDFAPTTTFAGRVLAIGTAAYEWDMNGKANAYIDQVQMLTGNSIGYLK